MILFWNRFIKEDFTGWMIEQGLNTIIYMVRSSRVKLSE